MRSTLFSSSLINLMGETGFRLFTDGGEGYRIQNRNTSYHFVDHQGFWTLEQFEQDVKQGETRTFRTHYELEQFLITQLRKLSRYRELEQLP